jgi:FixJ family two-component response regulator
MQKKMTARNEQQKQQKIANYLTTKIQITSIIIEGLKCNKSAGTAAKKTPKTRKRHRQESAKQQKVVNISNLPKKTMKSIVKPPQKIR